MLRASRFLLARAGSESGARLVAVRRYSSAPAEGTYEREIYDKLTAKLAPAELAVQDVSGGCGSMFAIKVVSDKFKGVPMVKQHRLVNEVLADDIAKWHGLQLRTSAPK